MILVGVSHCTERFFPMRRLVALLLPFLLVVGCTRSASPPPTLYSLSGKVTVGAANTPLKAGIIVFHPIKDGKVVTKGVMEPWAEVKEGSFSLTDPLGAPAGTYRVTVEPPPNTAGPAPKDKDKDKDKDKSKTKTTPASPIPKKFQDVNTSTLEAEVKESDNNYTFALK
jgi:hypothetical protein